MLRSPLTGIAALIFGRQQHVGVERLHSLRPRTFACRQAWYVAQAPRELVPRCDQQPSELVAAARSHLRPVRRNAQSRNDCPVIVPDGHSEAADLDMPLLVVDAVTALDGFVQVEEQRTDICDGICGEAFEMR